MKLLGIAPTNEKSDTKLIIDTMDMYPKIAMKLIDKSIDALENTNIYEPGHLKYFA